MHSRPFGRLLRLFAIVLRRLCFFRFCFLSAHCIFKLRPQGFDGAELVANLSRSRSRWDCDNQDIWHIRQ